MTVDYEISAGTATPGVDYTVVSGTLTFAVGETEKPIVVPLRNDALRKIVAGQTSIDIYRGYTDPNKK